MADANRMRRRDFPRQATQKNASATAGPGNSTEGWRNVATEEVETVSVVDADPPEGVTAVGLKLHDAPAGKPEQVNETAEENPFTGVTVTVTFPLCPCSTVSDDGLIELKEKSGSRIVYVADATGLDV